MITIVKFAHKSGDFMAFEFNGVGYLYLKEFHDGIATIKGPPGIMIYDFAGVISGCFSRCSNFKQELLKSMELPDNTPFKGINCVFNDLSIYVTQQHCSRQWILNRWQEKNTNKMQ